jgi:hypothetical protein
LRQKKTKIKFHFKKSSLSGPGGDGFHYPQSRIGEKIVLFFCFLLCAGKAEGHFE